MSRIPRGPHSAAPECRCGRVLLLHISLSIIIFSPKQSNREIAMEGILMNKKTYETPEVVQVVNLTVEDSILALSDYWSEPLD